MATYIMVAILLGIVVLVCDPLSKTGRLRGLRRERRLRRLLPLP